MKIKISQLGEEWDLSVPQGMRLLDYLQEAKISVNAACGGNGSCHKCRVKVQSGFLGVSAIDRKAFNESELTEGWRLSCQAKPKTNLEVFLPNVESSRAKPRVISFVKGSLESFENQKIKLICDLGSTGVVVALATETQILYEAHLLNKQIRFGADVMTRLDAAQKQGVGPLQKALEETLSSCLSALQKLAPSLYNHAIDEGIYCSGNSTMTSFLQGWDISTLAVSPFQPIKREPETRKNEKGITLHSLPLLSGFVGGDTVSGILHLMHTKAQAPWMLVDIGTNTEIALFNGKDELWFSSAPAGPAFEGGNITFGMRAENGAISEAVYKNSKWEFATIAGDVARGICGSGLMDVLYQAVKGSLISEDGYVPGGRIDLINGISLLADDVREFQLAKSATRTAAELLLNRSKIAPLKIYLAGNFAEHLNLESVLGIGLLPKGYDVEVVGNASLKGVWRYAFLNQKQRSDFTQKLEKMRNFVELALQDDFQPLFVKNLGF